MFKKFGAFTLAEVMITMAMLGGLAALTLSTLGHSIQKQTRVSEFKTAYSKLDVAIKTIIAEQGVIGNCYVCPSSDAQTKYGLSIVGTCTSKNTGCATLEKALMKELGLARTCDNSTDSSCIPPRYKTVSGCFTDFTKGKSFVLKNGMIIITDDNKSLTQFAIDVNGSRGPNNWGEDIFTFALTASESNLKGSVAIVNNLTILPPESCLPGGGDASKKTRSSAELLEEISKNTR